MDVYTANLAGLLALCGGLFAAQRMTPEKKDEKNSEKKSKDASTPGKDGEASQTSFLVVFALVMASDWLQGPFLYSLYREEHGIPSSTVSTLFTTGFLSGAVSGYFSGSVADKYGRRFACLGFCVASAASCILTMIPSVPLLFIGRALGGVATSLLFSVFESWMVTDFQERGLAKKGGDLSATFGLMSTLNSLVAIASGVSSEWMVAAAGTRKAPFMASVVLLVVAAWVISTQWAENYGESAISDHNDTSTTTSRLKAILTDPRVLSLGLASTMFEGSMYLFVFYWGPALQAAQSTPSTPLPYGIIFASFMAAVLASSLSFSLITRSGLLRYASLLLALLVVANFTFYSLSGAGQEGSIAASEQATFWLFCAFEACVGMYWPCMGYLKGRLVPDGVRAQVYGLFRIPLNLLVVASLTLAGGDDGAFGAVFGNCSKLLVAACGAVTAMMINEGDLP